MSPAAPTQQTAKRPTRRALAKQRTREHLLEAAAKLIADRGYGAATVRDIAEAAGLSTGAVFANFSDKADLFRELINTDCLQLSEQMAQVDTSLCTTREALQRLLAVAHQRHARRLGFIQAAISFSWQPEGGTDRRYLQGMEQVLLHLAAAMQAGVEAGELSGALDVRVATEMLWDCHLSNYQKMIFEGWTDHAIAALQLKQIDLLLGGYRIAGKASLSALRG